MKKLREIKRVGKDAFLQQYGKAVLLMFLVSLIPIVSVWALTILGVNFLLRLWLFVQLDLLRVISVTISLVALIVFLFLAQCVLHVGSCSAFLTITKKQKMEMFKMFDGFKNFGNSLGGMLWMILWIFLWSFLFIVPGIIKYYAYFMTPYLLADNPRVLGADAVELSKRMMKGKKGKLFLIQLSFIGWFFLSVLTLGILWVTYVGPYFNSVMAEYYNKAKEDALIKGYVTQDELLGAELHSLDA
ncbi:MAG: DUF975 family protein [Christensenella sp.]|nr:DUF975 family protein [Christensenella sp.]